MSVTAVRPLNYLTTALEAAGDVAYSWDLSTDRIEWTGRLPADGDVMVQLGTGRGLAGRVHPEDSAQRQRALAAHLDADAAFDCEYRLSNRADGFIGVHERGRAERDEGGRARRVLGVIRIAGARSGSLKPLDRPPYYDELTGHFTATRLRETVDRIIAENQRTTAPAAFLSIGVDNMVWINAKYGPDAADRVLIDIGRRLDGCLRENDCVGRLGDDRFGIVLSHCSTEDAGIAAKRILAAIASAPFAMTRGAIQATVSIGGVSFANHGATSYDVITCADAALADARRAGCGTYLHRQLSADLHGEHRRSRAIGDKVHAALRADRGLLAFQPIVSAATGAVDYYECLLRIRDPQDSIVSAGDFIPVIEQLGSIRLIDRLVLDKTIAELIAHDGMTLGFNVSGLTAADRPWLRALLAQLRDNPEIACRLVVEITETAALYDIEESARFVAALRNAGCRVALDDFGAGHTSLRHLQSLPVDTVKIDGSFTRNLTTSPDSRVFLRHLLGLARGFGFSTIAEGVETAEQAAILRDEGVGFLQGYYYGRPLLDRPWASP